MEQLKQTLLIVDDEKANVQFLNDKFKSSYNVKTANNGKTALTILSKFEIDLVLLDIVGVVISSSTYRVFKFFVIVFNYIFLFLTNYTIKYNF